MTTFWIAAVVLSVFVMAPLLLSPALRGTGASESTRRTVNGLAILLPAAALGLWLLLGTPAALDPKNVAQPETLDDAIAMLEARLRDDPASVEGWVLLGRSRMSQERFADARDAFAKAHALLPDEPDLMVEYADAQMRAAADGRFPPAATALLERVVAAHPQHQRALFYLGAQRFQAGQPADAAKFWETLLPLVETKTAEALRPQIDAARAQAGLPPLPAAPAPAVAGPALTVTVELAPAITDRLAEGATLFVFARPENGEGPPVAVRRVAADGFPVVLTLSDADRLMPTQTLSMQTRVQLAARISASGDASAAPGDLEAAVQVADVVDGAKITLVIDRVVP